MTDSVDRIGCSRVQKSNTQPSYKTDLLEIRYGQEVYFFIYKKLSYREGATRRLSKPVEILTTGAYKTAKKSNFKRFAIGKES